VAINPNLRAKQDLLEKVREEEKAAVREAALRSTYIMASMVLWPDVDMARIHEPFHRPLCDFIDETPPGGRRGAIVPRMHRKTFLLTVAQTVRRICVDPDVRILIVTALDDTAKKMSVLIKRQFTHNRSFAYYFPEMCIDEEKFGTQYSFEHPRRTIIEMNPTVRAAYLGAPLIGCRADIVICDDAVDEDKILNPELADRTNGQINELVPLIDLKPQYNMMFVWGTPKGFNDYYALMSGQASTTIKSEVKVPVFKVIRRSALEDEDGKPSLAGEPILPTVFTKQELLNRLEQCKLNPAQGEGFFMREYLCLVQAPSEQKFRAEQLATWVDPMMVPPNTIFSGFTIDSAFKDAQIAKARGDTTVCLVGHFDHFNNLYLTDGIRGRFDSETFRKQLLAMLNHPKNKSAQNLIKEKVGEGTIFTEFKRWFMDAKKPVVIFPVPVIGRGEKVLRIINCLQGPFMGRKIFFVKGQFPEDLHRVLVDELTHLGQWGHDDAADALALFFHPDVRPMNNPNLKSVVWKDVVSVPTQISTPWTNPMAMRQANPQVAQQDPKTNRLTPGGQDITLDHGTFMVQGSGPTEMPEFGWQPVLQRSGKDPFGDPF
jgi:hypothetical protein